MTNDGLSETLGTKLQQGGHGGTGKAYFKQADMKIDDDPVQTRRSMNYWVD